GTDIVLFTIDDIAPSGAFVWPGANGYVSSATVQVIASATDTQGDPQGSGVTNTQIEISTGTSSKYYWTGSSWTATQLWITTTTTANPWYYTIPTNALVTDNLYYLRMNLIDKAGNPFTSQTSSFTYVTEAPTTTFTSPINGSFLNALPSSQ